MSTSPEARHFLGQMPTAPQKMGLPEEAIGDSSPRTDDQTAPLALRSQRGLSWVMARSHWPR